MRYIAILTGCFLFAGCATIWNNRYATQKDFKVDSYACHQEQYRTTVYVPLFDREVYEDCMIGRSWRVVL